jgi:uncharacterized protein (TIGR02996 family)
MDESAFWGAVDAAQDDDRPKLVFADWLDERGDPRAACLRWGVAEHKHPAYDRIDTKTWDWWSRAPAQPIHYDISPRQYVVPMNLFSRLTPPGPGLWKGNPTYVAALTNLCAAWRACVSDQVDPLADDRPRPEMQGWVAGAESLKPRLED